MTCGQALENAQEILEAVQARELRWACIAGLLFGFLVGLVMAVTDNDAKSNPQRVEGDHT